MENQTLHEAKEDDDFEFAVVAWDPDTCSSTADEIFPIFNRNLLLEEPEAEIRSPEGIAPEADYCMWKPRTTEKCGKSVSTGSSPRWRLRDLVVRRSHSDGKEKFVFVETEEKKKEKKAVDAVAANRRYYERNRQGAGRKSFLPYKPGIVGFFANVNGVTRVHHPF